MSQKYTPQKFRKQPIEIEAMQFDGTDDCSSAIMRWANQDNIVAHRLDGRWVLAIHTPNGQVYGGQQGDWVVKDADGDFYPCTDSVFRKVHGEAISNMGGHAPLSHVDV